MTLILVLVGGAVGAVVRYLVSAWSHQRFTFPYGTLVVNVVGSFVVGFLAGLAAGADGLPDWVRALIGTGFCGALTTYSTFGFETVHLGRTGGWRQASINVAATLGAGIGAAGLGWLASS
jgi:CrcB protein